MHRPTERIVHTMAFAIPVVEHWLEQEIGKRVHCEGSIRHLLHHGATPRSVLNTDYYSLYILSNLHSN